MGSFNSQCFISRQILSSYDHCYIIPIIQNPKTVVNSIKDQIIENYLTTPDNYNDSEFVFYSYLITCTYDDYGKFDIVETKSNHKSLKYLFDSLYNDLADIDEKEDARNAKKYSIQKIYNPKQTYSINQLIEIFNELNEGDLLHERKLFVVKENKILSMNISSVSTYVLEYAKKTKYDFDLYFKNFNFKEHTIKEFLSLNGLIKKVNIDLFEDKILENEVSNIINSEIDNKIDLLKQILENRINTYLISALMYQLNISIEPLIYSGQDYDNSTGKEYYKVLNAIKKEEV